MELAELIKERRAQLGMTQLRLAEMLGRSASTIRSWERGATAPPPAIREALATALGVEPDALDFNVAGVADEADAEPDSDIEGADLLESALASEPVEPIVDQTTVMAEGIAMAMPVDSERGNDSADERASAEPREVEPLDEASAGEEAATDDTGDKADAFVDRDEDTDESEVIVAVPLDASAMPRLLGTALSTDVVPDLEETKVAAPLSATQVIGRGTSSTVAASPYPDVQGAATVMPVGSSETDWSEVRTYQTRRILTIAAFVGFIILLRWSMGGFAEGFATLKDSIMSNVNL
jgi:transcriptional regulator with XRE-family HTH domain